MKTLPTLTLRYSLRSRTRTLIWVRSLVAFSTSPRQRSSSSRRASERTKARISTGCWTSMPTRRTRSATPSPLASPPMSYATAHNTDWAWTTFPTFSSFGFIDSAEGSSTGPTSLLLPAMPRSPPPQNTITFSSAVVMQSLTTPPLFAKVPTRARAGCKWMRQGRVATCLAKRLLGRAARSSVSFGTTRYLSSPPTRISSPLNQALIARSSLRVKICVPSASPNLPPLLFSHVATGCATPV
mmetsp:Transcript_42244/g.91835  ORF Transcript_42244/g.91835 Transcript_42244/m.91835 type:complete len:241 (+) Transcript_42244:186-908(+)